MPLSIISIVINTLVFVVLNIDLYTDRFTLPDEGLHVWKSSTIASALMFIIVMIYSATVHPDY